MRRFILILVVGACGNAGNDPSDPSASFVAGEYTLELRSATLSSTRADASAWDDDGLPDPYVVVWRGETRFATSLGAIDTIEPAWNDTFRWPLALAENDRLALDVHDDDGSTDELMLACEIAIDSPETVPDVLGVLRYVCASETGEVEVWLRRNAE